MATTKAQSKKRTNAKKFGDDAPINEVVDYCAGKSKVWSEFLNEDGCGCTIGEMGLLAVGLRRLRKDTLALSDIFDGNEADEQHWRTIVHNTANSSDYRIRSRRETDLDIPKSFVPYNKRPAVLKKLKNFLKKHTPTFGDFKKLLSERLKERAEKYR